MGYPRGGHERQLSVIGVVIISIPAGVDFSLVLSISPLDGEHFWGLTDDEEETTVCQIFPAAY